MHVLLVEDEHLIRSALATLLELNADIDSVIQCETGEEALAKVRASSTPIDAAIVDLFLPGMDGVDTVAALRAEIHGLSCMILSSHARPGYLKHALSVGATGFYPKTVDASTLVQGLSTIVAGGRAIDSTLAVEALALGDSPLTEREAACLELSIGGTSIKHIARQLFLSEGTVRNYLSSAASKLDASNRFEAAKKAQERGWI